MPDYKSLFYKSQAKITDLEEQLEKITLNLIQFMLECENLVVESNNFETSEQQTR